MIVKMNFGKLRLSEFLSYCGELLAFLKGADKENLQLDTAVSTLDQKYELAIEVANRTRSSQYTVLLKDKDHRRDDSFLALRKYLEACMHRKDATIALNADKLLRIFRSHGWSLQSKGRAEQSAKMVSLIKELNLAENTALITSLTATDWYQDMVDDQAAYLQLQEDRTLEEASQTDYDTLEVYKELRISCEQIIEGIEVLNRMMPDPKYDAMENFINDCTQRYLTAVKARITKSENAKEAEETETVEE